MQKNLEFAGSDGLIFGLKMKSIYSNKFSQLFCGCDASWISNFISEKEVIIMNGSALNVIKSKIINNDIDGAQTQLQYLICEQGNAYQNIQNDLSESENLSFASVFGIQD